MKIIKGALLLTLILLISVSLTSGLELTASTGGNDGSSSTQVVYGATVDDYANEHIGLNPGDGTLSNAFSGSGSLPLGSVSKSDTLGNAVSASRSVNGKPGYTKWTYDWGTSKPYVSGLGYGVSAWVSMNVNNAYGITGGSSASNKEKDFASVSCNILSSGPTSSLRNYFTSSNAYTSTVSAYQQATSAAGNNVYFSGISTNNEKDLASSYITGSGNSYVGNPYNYVFAYKNIAYSRESTSGAYGSNYAQMISHVENKAPAKESSTKYTGAGDFGIQKNKNNILSGSVTGSADASMVYLTPSISGIPYYKTAYILEPYHEDFGGPRGSYDLRNTVFNSLLNKEYAVTYYRDSAVTRNRVGEMDDYWIALMDTHGSYNKNTGTSLMITRAAESNKYISPSDLKAMFTKNNGMTIFSACDSYTPTNSGTIPLYDAVRDKAWVSGGYDRSVYVTTNGKFLSKFFSVMTDYTLPWNQRTASSANIAAYNFVKSEDPKQKLILQPNNHDIYLV